MTPGPVGEGGGRHPGEGKKGEKGMHFALCFQVEILSRSIQINTSLCKIQLRSALEVEKDSYSHAPSKTD